jgi:hypothetical protein
VVSWQEVMKRFPEAFVGDTYKLREMAKRAMRDDHYAPPSKPIINLGMNKGGTTTMSSFFRCAGYKACHHIHGGISRKSGTSALATCFYESAWDNNDTPLLKTCGYQQICEVFAKMDGIRVDIVCSYPQHEHLDQMVAEEPRSTLLLPFRNFEAWIDSLY